MTADTTKLLRKSAVPADSEPGDERAERPRTALGLGPQPDAAPRDPPAPPAAEAAAPKRASHADQAFEHGEVLSGRYRIEDEIGRGGMGTVYRATQLLTGKRVALKSLLLSGPHLEERKKRFLREARAAAMLQHPNVLRVFDYGEHEGGLYMVSELLEGESLRARMRRDAMREVEAVSLLMPALRGVAAAHTQGIIHRDLKPENIFLCTPEPDMLPEAVVLDFGLTKLVNPTDSVVTMHGAVLGTPQYMAPEQAAGAREVDSRCDVYALGVILYEAVAGQRPLLGLQAAQLLMQGQRPAPLPLRRVAPHASEQLERILVRALAVNPEERHASIEELALELEELGEVPFRPGVRVSSLRPKALPEPRASTEGQDRPPSASDKRWATAALILVVAGALAAWASVRRQSARVWPASAVQHARPTTDANAGDTGRAPAAAAAEPAVNIAPSSVAEPRAAGPTPSAHETANNPTERTASAPNRRTAAAAEARGPVPEVAAPTGGSQPPAAVRADDQAPVFKLTPSRADSAAGVVAAQPSSLAPAKALPAKAAPLPEADTLPEPAPTNQARERARVVADPWEK
jgi:hypothetical protein